MAKSRTVFFCQNCGYESAKWLGKCPSCQEWNTFVEELIVKDTKSSVQDWSGYSAKSGHSKIIPLQKVEAGEDARITTPDPELNRVLGGGIVSGSIVLVAGEPGIGKSTLFLQIGLRSARSTSVEKRANNRSECVQTASGLLTESSIC